MKVLIIGLGSIAQKHIAVIQSLDENIELYALRSSESSTNYEGVKNVFSYTVARQIHPDFVIISNPTALHYDTLSALSDWSVPLFIEKPVLHTLEGADELVARFKKHHILTYVACNLRFLESLQFIKNQISTEAHALNEVNVYAGSYLPAWRPNTDFRQSYSANPELGGGIHLDLIHELDYIYWLFGAPKEVFKLLRSSSSLKIKAVDYANYQLVYDDFVVNVVLNYYRRDYKRQAEFLFENQTLILDLAKNEVSSSSNNGNVFEHENGILDTYKKQMNYFIGLVKNQSTTSFNTIEDGVNVLKIALNE